ncbi:Uncharacterized protein MCB1EB_1635 [Mycoavidus cysteinexigens]|uniref:Uncharacterized protein n=2 Tax=Mycoavidus cysteinexigens TaxID=1553431 RepID=A0A2Z6EWK3_9BURK|nr:hypothetical protein [Mycoavidus cysteinexigens]BBE09796.1 Uncharacterized protein MCB1EB_1635 [Mycoavidus cysteinexigens]GAM53860.1 phage protein [bacterium endosymbiont of Mortierella elongata FMR23-6]GLR01697.1 hypothetical protein GCM10007934_15090 [Mycoavidus cysteinexigens]
MEPTTSTGIAALIKYIGAQAAIAVMTIILTLLLSWPKNAQEGAARLAGTFFLSFIFGPLAAMAAYWAWPGLFEVAKRLTQAHQFDPMFGYLYVCAPFQVLAGLPAWWIVGAIVRWFERRKGMDIGEIIEDGRRTLSGRSKV